jgi:flagellar assembly protein FliH
MMRGAMSMAVRLLKEGAMGQARIQPLVMAEPFEGSVPGEFETVATLHDPGLPPRPPADREFAPQAHRDVPPDPDLAQIERSAFENGFHQGEKAGMEIADKKAEALMRRYGDSILELGRAKSAVYGEVEREVVRLAIEVAKKIVHREIQADPEIVQTLVHVALSHAAERSPVTVRVHPLDHRALLDKHPGWAEESGDGREVVIVADKTIERGGCLIQTECGDVDARIEEEFREVERAFFEGEGHAGT